MGYINQIAIFFGQCLAYSIKQENKLVTQWVTIKKKNAYVTRKLFSEKWVNHEIS